MSDETTKEDPKLVIIGGRKFSASCITLGIMRRRAGALKTVMSMKVTLDRAKAEFPSPEEFQAVIDIVGDAVKPLDPMLDASGAPETFEQFVDRLDFRLGVKDVLVGLTKVMKLSGYQEAAKEAEPQPGEPAGAASST